MAKPNIRMIQQVQPGYFVLHVTTEDPEVSLEVGVVTPEAMQTAIDTLEKSGRVEMLTEEEVSVIEASAAKASAEAESPEKSTDAAR